MTETTGRMVPFIGAGKWIVHEDDVVRLGDLAQIIINHDRKEDTYVFMVNHTNGSTEAIILETLYDEHMMYETREGAQGLLDDDNAINEGGCGMKLPGEEAAQ